MQFVIMRLSDKCAAPFESAQKAGDTLFGDAVYVVEVDSIEDLMKLATRSCTSSPGDVGLILWRKAPPSMCLPAELENLPAVEIYDDIRA